VKNASRRPKITVTAARIGVVSQAGAVPLTRTLRVTVTVDIDATIVTACSEK
jgi:hypothetical protein